MNIYKTQDQAVAFAKTEAITAYEKFREEDVNDLNAVLNSDSFLISNSSTQCKCGETPAVRVVFFPDGSNGDQFTGAAGWCEMCGEE